MKIKSILLIIVLCLPALRLQGYERSELIDSDAALVIRISNGAAFLNAIKNSPMGKLWNSPRMKPFLNNQNLEDALIRSMFSDQGKSKQKELEKVIHVNRQILSKFKGEVVAGFEKDDSFFVLVEMNETDYKTTLELIEEEHKLSTDTVVTKNHMFQGVELVQEIITGDDGVKNEWTAFYRDTFITSSIRPWLEKCIVRLKKEPPTAPPGPPSLKIHLPNG
ncbi:MAG: hypothetical protein GY950_24690, partial [bacterium]|nr:hypothetical protein [bacterium]